MIHQEDGSTNQDFAILDLGLITNTAFKSDTAASTISVEITAQLTDFTDDGALHFAIQELIFHSQFRFFGCLLNNIL